jgi:hypothetical protein
VLNRGFEILPQIHDLVSAVALESLYAGWDEANQKYVAVSTETHDWLIGQARTIRERYNLPVISIDYCPPADAACARDASMKIQALGLVPYVTDGGLRTMGRGGTVTPVKRRILVVQDPQPRTDLNISAGVRYLSMPLNYLGYTVDYRDVHDPLPQGDLRSRYAGIVIWLDDTVPHVNDYRSWLMSQVDAGMPIAMFTSFGVPLDEPLARKLGLQIVQGAPTGERLTVESQDAKLMGFEMKPHPNPRDYTPVQVGPSGRSLLRLRSGNFVIDGAALTPWGGYALRPFSVFELGSVDQARWVLQPLEFLRTALRLPDDVPVPDTTTVNGRRLMMSHIDGDGFASRVEFSDKAHPNTAAAPEYSGDPLYRVLRDKKVPTTVSLVEAEVTDEGPFKTFAPHLRTIGRKIFELPNVEVATHTYTHPLEWMRVTGLGHGDTTDYGSTEGGSQTTESGLSYDIPGYVFNIDREVSGSIQYINSQVAPANKPVKVVFWSGDCQVPEPVLKAAYETGLPSLNGGDTLITRSNPSWTAIAPIGVRKGRYYQVFAPNQNEEMYTNLWQGPFYGYKRVLETLEMTESPIRFKPIDLYYHMFSGTKYASVRTLEKVLDTVLKQSITPVFASEYANNVLDWLDTSVARDGRFWVVRNAGTLRTVRLPAGKAPDLSTAQGVAGYLEVRGVTYVHLTGSEARFAVIDAKQAPHTAYLAEANGRIDHFVRNGNNLSFDLAAHVAPQFRLANAQSCRVEKRSLSAPDTLHVDIHCGT